LLRLHYLQRGGAGVGTNLRQILAGKRLVNA
jgi:hypothetical protein